MNVRTDSLVRHFQVMARNNRWSNYRLLKACAQLSQAEFEAKRTSFFPSLVETYQHILLVDYYYLDALQVGGLGRKVFSDRPLSKAVEAFTTAQNKNDRALMHFCDRLTAEDLARSIEIDRGAAGIKRERIERVLSHLFLHQTHHRGQVHAMLSGTSVKPPQLDDFLLSNDAPLRADDLRELGWTETEIGGNS